MMHRATGIRETSMIVAIVTFQLPQPTTLAEITKTFQGTAPKYRGVPGLLQKYYYLSEDGRRGRRHQCVGRRRGCRSLLHSGVEDLCAGKLGKAAEDRDF